MIFDIYSILLKSNNRKHYFYYYLLNEQTLHTHDTLSSMLPRYLYWDIGGDSVSLTRRWFATIFIFSLSLLALQAQSPLIDSLLVELKTEIITDSTRVDMLNTLADAYMDYDVDQIPEYAREALRLAESINYPSGKALALAILAYYANEKRDLDRANLYYDQSIEIAREIGDDKVLFEALAGKGMMQLEKGRYPEALAYFHEGVDIGKVADIDDVAHLLSTIAWIHGHSGDQKQEYRYREESIAWAAQAEDAGVQIHGLQQAGYLAWRKKDHKNAIKYYNEALEFAVSKDLKWSEERVYYSISAVYIDLEEYDKALEASRRSVQISRGLGNELVLVRNLLGLAEVHVEAGQYDEAIAVSEEGVKLSIELGIPDLRLRFLNILKKGYKGKKDFYNSFNFQESYYALEDSLNREETSKSLAEMESVYQLEKKTIENELLIARQEEQTATINEQKILTIAGAIVLVLLMVLGGILFKAYRTKAESSKLLESEVKKRTQELRTANEKLVRSNKLLENFAHITSNDIKEPLRNMCSFAGLLRYELRPAKNSKGDEYLGHLIDGTKQLQRLVEDILDFSKISQKDKEDEETMPISLDRIMREIDYLVSMNIEQRPSTLIWSDDLPTFEGNPTKYLMLFKNLVENGFKFNDSDHPRVEVSYLSTDENEIISITDNGIGIESNYLEGIFGMFTRLHHRGVYKGSGLGLAVCQIIVEDLGGRIEVESEVGKGSTFKVYLKKAAKTIEKPMYFIGYD